MIQLLNFSRELFTMVAKLKEILAQGVAEGSLYSLKGQVHKSHSSINEDSHPFAYNTIIYPS